MEKETRITAPEGCEIEKVEIVDSVAVVTFKEKEQKLPKSFEEFCVMFPGLFLVPFAFKPKCDPLDGRIIIPQVNISSIMADFTEDPEISDAIIALLKLILLRNCYNGDWAPDWDDEESYKYTIFFVGGEIKVDKWTSVAVTPLYFRTADLRDEFLCYFRPLIEKLKPLYGIKKGGEE